MKRRSIIALAATVATGVLLCAAPAVARDLPYGGMTATEVASWIRTQGFAAQVKPDPTTAGDQIVSTSTDGIDVDIYLYDCSGDGDARRCTSMQYASGFSPQPGFTLEKVNAWNSSNRYIKAYLTSGNTLYGEYDMDLSPGGTYEMLDDELQNWRRNIVKFKSRLVS